MDIHFRPKNENESHLIILVFLSFSYIQSPSQPYNAPPLPHPVLRFFCRWSLSTGFHFPHLQCIDIFVAFSTWHFNPWTVCFPGLLLPSETVFHNLCTVLYWRLCSLTNSPIVKYPLNWGWCALSIEGFLKQWLPNGKLLLLSLTKCRGVPCSLPSRITTKVLKNCKTFSSRPRPRLHDPRPRPRLSFLSSRRLETKTLVSRTTSLVARPLLWNALPISLHQPHLSLGQFRRALKTHLFDCVCRA